MIPHLVDRTSFEKYKPVIAKLLAESKIAGFDIETQDANRHEGLNLYMKVNKDGKKSASKKLVFDIPRTVITGFSIYPKCDTNSHNHVFYFNMAQADEENRLTVEEVLPLLKAYRNIWVAHNAPFEIMMCRAAWGWIPEKMFCSMQALVSWYGDDEYPWDKLCQLDLYSAIEPLHRDILKSFQTYDRGIETMEQGDLISRFVGKSSKSAFNWNGISRDISYGYGLKQAVRSHFNYDMVTFDEVLAGRAHMGQLTGAEVVSYGCDDAYWAVQLYELALRRMHETDPLLANTFLTQENPMIYIYADVAYNGIRVDLDQVKKRRVDIWAQGGEILRNLRHFLNQHRQLFYSPHNASLAARDLDAVTYAPKNRQKFLEFMDRPDHKDILEELLYVRSPITVSYAGDRMGKNVVNIGYYQCVRTLIYDVFNVKLVVGRDRKVQSDAEALEAIRKSLEDGHPAKQLLGYLRALADIEQRMKLYITPYLQLHDPETHKLHSMLSSRLATRRLASSFPNFMQLPKTGDGAAVRSFFKPDKTDHVIMSLDWSQIELVRIAEVSECDVMCGFYSSLPYKDMHSHTCAQLLDLPEDFAKAWKALPYEAKSAFNKLQEEVLFVDDMQKPLSPSAWVKFVRTEIGKGANFNYWYSGALQTIGERLGWGSEKQQMMNDRYRNTYPGGEAWRVQTQDFGSQYGYVEIGDGHRRVRMEATPQWMSVMNQKFGEMPDQSFRIFGNVVTQKLRNRARNQMVNAKIQGSCATLTKRTILRFHREFEKEIDAGLIRFMMCIHDELVFSVHRDFVLEARHRIREIMCDHPDMFKRCVLDATASIGMHFQPFDKVKAPFGQIELDEAPAVDWLPSHLHGSKLGDTQVNTVVQYLFGELPKPANGVFDEAA